MSDQESTRNDPESKPAPLAGLLSANFELEQELGSGASGTVYAARTRAALGELPAGSEIAVKFLRQELLSDPDAARQLRAEGRLGMRVRSPHVARIFAIETIEVLGLPVTYLVMERVRGENLRAFLQHTGRAVSDLTRRIGMDTALGLVALHRLGIVHRDIKPENLALTPEGRIKIMDLGLARRRGRRGAPSSGGFFGSLAYASPETLKGHRAGPASDLYALGLVLFELLTGTHPFADCLDADAMIAAHLGRAPTRPSQLAARASAFLEEIVLDLLAKDPAHRPQSARELALILEQGEGSRYWRRRERLAPILASRRRLRGLRRFAPTAFVGRHGARRRLNRLLREARAGRGGTVRIIGPHGSGRRRLLDECLDHWLREREDLLFFGGLADLRLERVHGAPFVAMLQDALGLGDAADSPKTREHARARLARVCKHRGEPARHLAELLCGGDQGTSPGYRASLLADALLGMLSPDRTLLLRIDRADRLDTTAHMVVERLARALPRCRCLLFLVLRPDPGPLAGPHRDLHLPPMAKDEFVQLARLLFADRAFAEKPFRAAWQTLGGIAGNLQESLETLAARGRLLGEPGSYHGLDPDTELRPAEPLLARLRRRVRALAPRQRFVLLAGAILGERFLVADLVQLTGQPELLVLEALSAFQDRVVRAERGQARFVHRDYRRALRDLVAPGTAKMLHRQAAWLLEARGGPPLEIGLHFSRAFEHQASLEPLLAGLESLVHTGSRRASRRIARRLAIHLDAAAETTANRRRRLRYLLLAGEAANHAGRTKRARAAFERAERLADELGDEASCTQARRAKTSLP